MTTISVNEKTGYTYVYIYLPFGQTSTFHSDRIVLDKKAAIAEADSIIRDAHMRNLHTISSIEFDSDYTDEEEQEWDSLFIQAHVQAGLNRLAEEAERQFVAGETEEGGFAVE